jgi:hypothetical protein
VLVFVPNPKDKGFDVALVLERVGAPNDDPNPDDAVDVAGFAPNKPV